MADLVRVRAFLPEDLEELGVIAEQVWPGSTETDEALLAKCARGVLLTAVLDGRPVGYLAAFSWFGDLPALNDHAPNLQRPGVHVWWHIHDGTVAPWARGRGAARALLREALDEGARRGHTQARAIAVSREGLAGLEAAGFRIDPDLHAPEDYHGAPVLTRSY